MKKLISIITILGLLVPSLAGAVTTGFRSKITATTGSIAANILELDDGTLIAGGNMQAEANSDQIQRSINGGNNWSVVLDMNNEFHSFNAPFLASDDDIYFGTVYSVGNGIGEMYRSTNGGLDWTNVLTSESSAFWFLDEDNNGDIYAAEYSWGIQDANENYAYNIWKTVDNGDNWTKWFTHPTAPNTAPLYRNSIRHIHAIWIDPYDRQLYASFGEQFEPNAYYDGGKTYKINSNGTLGDFVQIGGNGITGVTFSDTGATFYADDAAEDFIVYKMENGVRSTVFQVGVAFGHTPGPILGMGTGRDGVIYALPNYCSEGRLFSSYDDGETWGELVFDLQGGVTTGSMFINGNSPTARVYVSTTGNYVSVQDYTKAELKDLFSSKTEIRGSITLTP